MRATKGSGLGGLERFLDALGTTRSLIDALEVALLYWTATGASYEAGLALSDLDAGGDNLGGLLISRWLGELDGSRGPIIRAVRLVEHRQSLLAQLGLRAIDEAFRRHDSDRFAVDLFRAVIRDERLLVYPCSQETLRLLARHHQELSTLELADLIATAMAASRDIDYRSRYFARDVLGALRRVSAS